MKQGKPITVFSFTRNIVDSTRILQMSFEIYNFTSAKTVHGDSKLKVCFFNALPNITRTIRTARPLAIFSKRTVQPTRPLCSSENALGRKRPQMD